MGINAPLHNNIFYGLHIMLPVFSSSTVENLTELYCPNASNTVVQTELFWRAHTVKVWKT